MGIQTPVRKLAAKALPRPQATTVLAIKALSARDDIRIQEQVLELVEWCTPSKLVIQLTGAGNEAAINRMCHKVHGRAFKGRPVTNIGNYFADPIFHFDASYFLNSFAAYQPFNNGVLDAQAFIGAYRNYRNVTMAVYKKLPRIPPAEAHMIARAYLKKECVLSHCQCGVHYLQSHQPVKVGKALRCGSCPACAVKNGYVVKRGAEKQPVKSIRHIDTTAAINGSAPQSQAHQAVRLTPIDVATLGDRVNDSSGTTKITG